MNMSGMQRLQGYNFALNNGHRWHSDLSSAPLPVPQQVYQPNLQKHSGLLFYTVRKIIINPFLIGLYGLKIIFSAAVFKTNFRFWQLYRNNFCLNDRDFSLLLLFTEALEAGCSSLAVDFG